MASSNLASFFNKLRTICRQPALASISMGDEAEATADGGGSKSVEFVGRTVGQELLWDAPRPRWFLDRRELDALLLRFGGGRCLHRGRSRSVVRPWSGDPALGEGLESKLRGRHVHHVAAALATAMLARQRLVHGERIATFLHVKFIFMLPSYCSVSEDLAFQAGDPIST